MLLLRFCFFLFFLFLFVIFLWAGVSKLDVTGLV